MEKVYSHAQRRAQRPFLPGKTTDYLMPGPDLPYIVLDRQAFQKAGVTEKAAEEAVAELLPAAVASLDPHRQP